MLPRWHILLGAILTLVFWAASPNISFVYLGLIFLSSFLIDFDHYVVSALKNKSPSLKKSFSYHSDLRQKIEKEKKKGIRKRGDFHLFHTVEFHLLVGLLGFFWAGFFYIFIGMIFHSLLDLGWLLHKDLLHAREFFFFNWIRKSLSL